MKLFEQLNMATNFESMSKDLLMDLFEYCDLYTLFISFSSLNSRIDQLLRHCQVHVDLDLVQPTDFIRFLAHILPQVNAKNIRSLHASKVHQIKVLADDQSLDYFNHLRSLDLKHISSNLLQSMVSRISFSHLQRLKLDITRGRWEENMVIFSTFSWFEQLTSSSKLQRCWGYTGQYPISSINRTFNHRQLHST